MLRLNDTFKMDMNQLDMRKPASKIKAAIVNIWRNPSHSELIAVTELIDERTFNLVLDDVAIK